MVIELLIDHRLDVRCFFCNTQVIQCDPSGGAAWEFIGISEINDHLYEGRWSPKWIDGKRISRNVYATTREECELKLAQLIRASKEELAMLKKAKGKKGRHIKKQ